jgi:hypothetical protein
VDRQDLDAELTKLNILALLLLGFVIGGYLGGKAYNAIGSDSLYFASGACGLMGVVKIAKWGIKKE